MTKLVLNAEQRNAIRAIVRKNPGFDAFRAVNGNFASRMLSGELLHRAIVELGHMADLVAVMGGTPDSDTMEGMRDVTIVSDGDESDGDPFLSNPAGTEMKAMPDAAATLAENVLSPLRPFLSPALLDTVDKALSPIVAAALKPAVEKLVEKTITVDRIVTVDATGATVAPAFIPANRVGASTIGSLFGISSRIKHADKPMSVWNAVDAPEIDPFYAVDVGTLSKLVSAIDPALPRQPANVWLAGPAGTGKSTMPEQIAARASRPFVAITFHRAVEPSDIIGGNGLANGATKWVDGVLTRAIRRPGTVILLDEITLAPPGIAAMLQTLLSSRKMTLPTGEVVSCADGVAFVCADNTRGFGDDSGLYAGTHQANAALVDRMARMLSIDYLDAALEAQALANHTLAPKAACQRVVAFVNVARKLGGFENVPLSLRRQVAFVKMAADGYSISECFMDTFLTRLPDVERETLRAAFRADFDIAAFEAEMRNAPIPAKTNTSTAFDAISVE